MVNPELLREVPIFALLDADERQVLAQQVSMSNFKKGDLIYKADQPGGLAYVVQQGMVQISVRDANHEVVVVDIADHGGICGFSSMLAGQNHQTTAIALEDTTAIEIDRDDLTILLNARPMAGLDMLTIVEQQLRAAHELMRTRVTKNPNEELEDAETFGERMADNVARFGGSWTFVIIFGLVLAAYVITNELLPHPWDPYPFILLNLFLSMLAAIQAPVIMMSQNRQDGKDRVRAELDYRVNLKAELEIEELLQRVGDIEQILTQHRREMEE